MPTPSQEKGYTAGLVQRVVGISYDRLRYWDRTGFIQPSIRAGGVGIRRRYSFADLIRLKTAKQLLDHGLTLQRLRKAMHYLKEREPHLTEPLAELKFLTNGKSVFALTEDAGTARDILNQNQLVWSVAIGHISRQTRTQMHSLAPEEPAQEQDEDD